MTTVRGTSSLIPYTIAMTLTVLPVYVLFVELRHYSIPKPLIEVVTMKYIE